jgi:hypothetical protein
MVDATSPDNLRPAEVRHELSDVKLSWVLGFAASLAALGVLTLVAMWGLFLWLLQRPSPVPPPASLLVAHERGHLPPEPRLEGLQNLEPRMGSPPARPGEAPGYGWVDRQAGVIRMPPEQAMQVLLSTKRLPCQPSPAGARAFAQASTTPTAANSGRDPPGDPP